MEITELLQAAETLTESRIGLLIEGGAFEESFFRLLLEQNIARMHSLYQHPQLQEAKMAGPWLLNIENPEELADWLNRCPQAAGVIFHSLPGHSLAAQLSWGCTPITPENKVVISRFYTREVLQPLAQCAGTEWHAFLFQAIQQWWMPDESRWTRVTIPSSTARRPLDHAVRIDKKTWEQIDDRPDVASVLAQWEARSSARAFYPCIRRSMTIKALNRAQAAGLTASTDRALYALVYLEGGKPLLESEAVQEALPDIARGKRRLMDVLLAAERR